MRIIAGRHRGRVLRAPEGAATRPTADRVRQALFDMLWHAPWGGRTVVQDQLVLDAFAGTGALGLEALSRGAARVAFVDDGTKARALLRANIEKMQAMGTTDVWRRDATRLGPNRGPGYSLVFLDPPYHKGLGEAALASAIEGGWLAPGAVIVWEEGTPPQPPDGFTRLDQRKYGDTLVTLLKAPE